MKNRANRANARNEVINLKILLLQACKIIEGYFPEAMEGRLRDWWRVQKNLALLKRVSSSEFGVLQQAMEAEEARQEQLDSGE